MTNAINTRLAQITAEIDLLVTAVNDAEDRRVSLKTLADSAIATKMKYVAEQKAAGVEFVSHLDGFAAHHMAVSSLQRSMNLADEEREELIEKINALYLEESDLRLAVLGVQF